MATGNWRSLRGRTIRPLNRKGSTSGVQWFVPPFDRPSQLVDMGDKIVNLLDAVHRRKSTRTFSMEALSEDTLEKIKAEVDSPDMLFQDSEINFKVLCYEEVEDFISGLIAGYGKIEAPYYILAFCGKGEKDLENLGYTLEKIVLEMTRMEVATCWMGSHFDKETLTEKFGSNKELKPRVLIAFGSPGDDEKALREKSEEASRKDLSEIILNDKTELSEDWIKVIEYARLAPSAMNSQPWRFEVDGNKVHLYLQSGEGMINKLGKAFSNLEEMNRIDVGIALRHVQIAAEELFGGVEFRRLGPREEDSSYVISGMV